MALLTVHRPGIPVPLTVERGGTGQTSLAGLQAALGLGTMAYQNHPAVAITGGTAVGLTHVGIGTGTITAPLTFAAIEGQKLHLWSNGLNRYGLAIAGGLLVIHAGTGARVGLGDLASDGSTFNETLSVTGSRRVGIMTTAPDYPLHVIGDANVSAHMGIGAATLPGQFHLNAGSTQLLSCTVTGAVTVGGVLTANHKAYFNAATGFGYVPVDGLWIRAGASALDTLSLNRGNAAPRWALDCAGQGYIAQLGVYYGAEVAASEGMNFRTGSAHVDVLGAGYVAQGSYSIRAGNSWFDALGAGYAGGSGYSLRAGSAAIDSIYAVSYSSIAGAIDGRWNFVNWGSSYFASTCQFAATTGFGYAPDGAHWIRAGSCYFDSLGLGQGAAPATHSLVVAGLAQFNGAVYVTSTTQMATYSAVAGAPDGRFTFRMYGAIYCDGVPYNGGGGPWVAFSDARLKHNIQEIPCPLETMTRLHGVCYEYADNEDGKPPGMRYGVLAQEVETVLPAWVGELSGYKTTQLSQFEALAIESFKVITQRLTRLEEQV